MSASLVPTRRGPVDLPGPDGDNTIAREPLWHAYGTGVDQPDVPAWMAIEELHPDLHVAPPPAVRPDAKRVPPPAGTTALLAGLRYPDGRTPSSTSDSALLGHALVAAFGVLRHEPANPFNPHRGYASARCLFPVQVAVDDGARWYLLQPQRNAMDELPATTGGGRRVALLGQYSRIPRGYRWFRGSLVNLELGITLRALCVALELFGLPGRLVLPGTGSATLLDTLALGPSAQWSLPLTVELDGPSVAPAPVAAARLDLADDPVLAELVEVNRAQAFAEPPAPLGAAVPDLGSHALSWADLLWQRTSGRMPRGLHGMSGRPGPLPESVLADALAWLAVPPPSRTLAAVADAVTVTAAVHTVEAHNPGVYRFEHGALVQRSEDPTVAAQLERVYGYPQAPDNGCDVRNAGMIWFLSVRPRELARLFGPGGWTAAQYVCGWLTHALCLAAAATGHYARPVRAFTEIPTQRILGLPPDEMIVLAVVVGTPRPTGGPLLDLRR